MLYILSGFYLGGYSKLYVWIIYPYCLEVFIAELTLLLLNAFGLFPCWSWLNTHPHTLHPPPTYTHTYIWTHTPYTYHTHIHTCIHIHTTYNTSTPFYALPHSSAHTSYIHHIQHTYACTHHTCIHIPYTSPQECTYTLHTHTTHTHTHRI